MTRSLKLLSFMVFTLMLISELAGAKTPLNPGVRLEDKEDEVSTVFQDVVVVQRKAKDKAKKMLFNVYGSFDFSDGPITMYGLNLSVGYAVSDFWEVYFNYVPTFVTNERSIVGMVNGLVLEGGYQARLIYAKPLSQIGTEVIWAPAYGKDSWGPKSLVRSDTFVKFGFATISYEGGENGLKYTLAVGKTYFLSEVFNLRVAAGMSQLQTIVGVDVDNPEKSFRSVAILEAGWMYYW